jgi:hypothetical protein
MYKFNSEKLAFEKVNIKKYIAIITLGFVMVFILSSYIWKEVVIIHAEKEVRLRTDDSFSKEKLFLEIDKYSFKYPDIVKAQAIAESNHFKAPVFKQNNNMFGMREAMVRITTANGSNLNHAYYENWRYCVTDRALYEARYLSKLTRAEYFSYLDQVYAEGDGYSKLLKNIIKTNKL